jgi:hypothetical protein
MDINAVTTIITTVGFPIACCIYMAYEIKDMNVKHTEEMNAMKDAVNANTNAIVKLETLINQLTMRLTVKEN